MELYHEIFGSVLDKREMTPYLLRNCDGYENAMAKATAMLANRGFDVLDGRLPERELSRSRVYVRRSLDYFRRWLFPFLGARLEELALLGTPRAILYREAASALESLETLYFSGGLSDFALEDPRRLFLLVSSGKYPDLFRGYAGGPVDLSPSRRIAACALLKMCHLIKSLEEDSQDIHDYAELGLFLQSEGVGLTDLYGLDWRAPELLPEDEGARRAFVKLSAFFRKLNDSVYADDDRGCLVFDSGDGIRVDILELKARLKSPESMFAKLGKDSEGEAYDIRDILAVTFLLREREDSLALFHALQKRGVILQEYAVSTSITQTLFDDPEDMGQAVRRLMENLERALPFAEAPSDRQVRENSEEFFRALSMNAVRNPHSSDRHRKFQCKINFPLPVHRDAATRRILIPGTAAYDYRNEIEITTQQHTLPVELRISDRQSWELSEKRGEAHHEAYKTRQLLALASRLFGPLFGFPPEAYDGLREDQEKQYS